MSTSSVVSCVDWIALHLKFTNEPSVFVDGDLAEWIIRSASDQICKSSPYGSSLDLSWEFSRKWASRHLSRKILSLWCIVLRLYTQNQWPTLLYTLTWCVAVVKYWARTGGWKKRSYTRRLMNAKWLRASWGKMSKNGKTKKSKTNAKSISRKFFSFFVQWL